MHTKPFPTRCKIKWSAIYPLTPLSIEQGLMFNMSNDAICIRDAGVEPEVALNTLRQFQHFRAHAIILTEQFSFYGE